jgi:hypothetical protein
MLVWPHEMCHEKRYIPRFDPPARPDSLQFMPTPQPDPPLDLENRLLSDEALIVDSHAQISALFDIVMALCKQAGLSQVESVDLIKFFDNRRKQVAQEYLLALEDVSPGLAAKLQERMEAILKESQE